jgi:hypothetical protein
VGYLRVHQLLHGYKNGHELLAGSVKLSEKDSELVARLSDLSGTLQTSSQFYPYLTVYPLPSRGHYAIARTWLDEDAPRSGCVLTHTILVSTADWNSDAVHIVDIEACLSRPIRAQTDRYMTPLIVEMSERKLPIVQSTPVAEIEGFVAKYFGEGMRPVVWFRDSDPAELLLSIMVRLWPNLRMNFAACTLSLQPRSLPGEPFDLLFAPTSAYSRFARVARENLIETSKLSRSDSKLEPWVSALAQAISHSQVLPVPADWPDFEQALGAEPTAIRWLYLLNDLRARTSESPMAALGVMDVVETLCPEPGAKPELKTIIAESAVSAGDRFFDVDQTFAFYQLVCERLSHQAYCKIGDHIFDALSHRVESKTLGNVEEGLSSYELLRTKSRDDSRPLQAFREGIIRALLAASASFSPELIALHNHDAVAVDIVPANPLIAEGYLRLNGQGGLSADGDVARWLSLAKQPVDWLAFAQLVVRLSAGLDDIIISEIFPHLTAREVELLLHGVSAQTLDDEVVSGAIETLLASRHSLIVRRWAAKLCDVSEGAAHIAGATFELSSSGLSELLKDAAFTKRGQLAVFAEMILRVPEGSNSSWLRDVVSETPNLFSSLLSAAAEGSPRAARALSRMLPDIALIAPEWILSTIEPLDQLTPSSLFGASCSLVIRSAFVWILRGRLGNDVFDRVAASPKIARWIYSVDGSWLAGILASETHREKDATSRAWSWLATAPEPFYRSRSVVTITLVGQLCRQTSGLWSRQVENNWRDILERADGFCEARFSLRHSVQALEFAFGNTQLPLAGVVRRAFPVVYNAVAEQSPIADEADSLFSYDWDRAKALRKNLVEAFYRSDWAPGDLALTAQSSFGLRKLFKRVWRKWHGEAYVGRIIRDLGSRTEPDAAACKLELASFASNSDFYEPWD